MRRDELAPSLDDIDKRTSIMLKNASRSRIVAAWCGVVVALFAVSVFWGATTSVASAELWLLACLAPPAVMLLVWRAPTQTVAELLYDTTHPNTDVRP
jgi:hypothetical protein